MHGASSRAGCLPRTHVARRAPPHTHARYFRAIVLSQCRLCVRVRGGTIVIHDTHARFV